MEPMPVDDLGVVSLVLDVHLEGLAFGYTKQWTGDLAVIANRFDGASGRQFKAQFADSQRDVRRGLARSRWVLSETECGRGQSPAR